MYVWQETTEDMRYLLWFLLNVCVVETFFGWAIKRIATRIAMYGIPLPEPPMKPRDYNPGDWLLEERGRRELRG